MNQIKNKKGFTIVETLIVLAVTGVFFMSTATLIQGQVERNRYQDSMRQLQALLQTTINDVEDGYMASTNGNNKNNLLIGKRFWFCGDFGTPHSVCTGVPTDIMTTETVRQDSGTVTYNDLSTQALPAGLKFLYFRAINTDDENSYNLGGKQNEFGSSILLTDANGETGKDITTLATARLYNRGSSNKDDFYTLSSVSANGFLLCFEGLHKGSIELGGLKNGNTVVMKPVDGRCD